MPNTRWKATPSKDESVWTVQSLDHPDVRATGESFAKARAAAHALAAELYPDQPNTFVPSKRPGR